MHLCRLSSPLLALAVALPAQISKDASFGEWPYLVGNLDNQVNAMVAAATSNGLDTIYINLFRATSTAFGTLWITDKAGTWNTAWGPVRPGGAGIDVSKLVAAAHAANVQVVGVLKCFDASVQPTDAAHRAYLLTVIDWFVNSYDAAGKPYYDLDGLALDYIRFVSAGCGNDPTVVTGFLAQVRQKLGALSLHCYLIAGRYDFDGPVYDGNFKSYSTVMSTLSTCYGQDWEKMAQYVDVMVPMAYTANGSIYSTYALHQAYVRQVAAYCRTACQRGGYPARRVSPAIRCYSDSSETATPQTIDASITGALGGGGDGYQAFRYGTMQAAWWPVLQQYAAPGPNRPIPVLNVSVNGLTSGLDGTQSHDNDQTAASLKVRFDAGNDGSFETAWLANTQAAALLARSPGAQRVGMQVQDQDGLIGATTRAFTAGNPLGLDRATLSATFGGSARVQLGVGHAGAGYTYLVTAGLSGSAPGTPLGPGLTLPLNLDGVSFGLIAAVNTPILQAGLGSLDAQGAAVATFAVPPGVLGPISGRTMTWAALGADASAQIAFVSNAGTLLILP